MDLHTLAAEVESRRRASSVRRALLDAAEKLIEVKPVAPMYEPSDRDCMDAAAMWAEVFAAIMPLFRAMTDHAASELGVGTSDWVDQMSDMQEEVRGAFLQKADRLREWEHERAVDIRGYAKALSWGVD